MFDIPFYDFQPEGVTASTYVVPSTASSRINRSYLDFIQPTKGVPIAPIGDTYQLPGNSQPAASLTISVDDIVNKLKRVWGLSAIQIADLVGVSRPSLYNHLSGKETPKTMDGYLRFWNLANEVEKNISADIRPGLKSILVNGKTLLGHLKSQNLSNDNILFVCQEIAKKITKNPVTLPSVEEQRKTSRIHGTLS